MRLKPAVWIAAPGAGVLAAVLAGALHGGSGATGSARPAGVVSHAGSRTLATVHPGIPPTRVRILTAVARTRGRSVDLRISCQKGEAIRLVCHGRLQLELPGAAGASTAVGSVLWAIENTREGSDVRVPLSMRATRALQARHAIRLRAVAQLAGGEAQSSAWVTLEWQGGSRT